MGAAMAGLGITVLKGIGEEFKISIFTKGDIIAIAATAAIKGLVNPWKALGRSNIAAAGFSKKWQNTLSVNAYPSAPKKFSLKAAAVMKHKISYAGIFDKSGPDPTITGHPFLWLPLPDIEGIRVGRSRISPRALVQKGVKLRSINRPGKPPLLAARIRLQQQEGQPLASVRLQLSDLTSGGTEGKLTNVPLFVGLRQTTLRKRFDLASTAVKARSLLPGLYAKALPQVIEAANTAGD